MMIGFGPERDCGVLIVKALCFSQPVISSFNIFQINLCRRILLCSKIGELGIYMIKIFKCYPIITTYYESNESP
jgi:hypothetical protein